MSMQANEPRKKREKRTKKVIVRMTPSEHLEFSELAQRAGVTISQMVRHELEKARFKIKQLKVVKTTELSTQSKAAIRQLAVELAKIGNNLNQIARHSNQLNNVDFQVLQMLVKIKNELDELKKENGNGR